MANCDLYPNRPQHDYFHQFKIDKEELRNFLSCPNYWLAKRSFNHASQGSSSGSQYNLVVVCRGFSPFYTVNPLKIGLTGVALLLCGDMLIDQRTGLLFNFQP